MKKIKATLLLMFMTLAFAVLCVAAEKKNPTSDEANVAAIIKGGDLTAKQMDPIAKIMSVGRDYGMQVDYHYRINGHSVIRRVFAGNKPGRMETLKSSRPRTGELVGVRVHLWKDPSPKVMGAARARAKAAIKQIYAEISALRKSYPELEKFDAEHVSLTDQSIDFQSIREKTHMKAETPCIAIALREPQIGVVTQAAFPDNTLFPSQKMLLAYRIYMKDETLQKKIDSIVTKAVKPLLEAEKSMGGEYVEGVEAG